MPRLSVSAAVSHLVARYNANQQSRGRKLYQQGQADAAANRYDDAIDAFRAALTCDPTNSQYQLSLARALRDSNDPRRLDEAESYLIALWQRAPQDAAVNLALARVAARRGSIEDATRYYHNAMYGVWNSDPDANRSKARVELIQFLLKKGAPDKAESELMALATALPPAPDAHLQAAQLFAQAQDYAGESAQYEEVLRFDPLQFRCTGWGRSSRLTAPAITSLPAAIYRRQPMRIRRMKTPVGSWQPPNSFCATIPSWVTSRTPNAIAASLPPLPRLKNVSTNVLSRRTST